MVLPFIRVAFGMLPVFATFGICRGHQSIVHVARSLVSIMQCAVLKGALPTLRHNEVRDLTVDLLTVICGDVEREPLLQPVTGEQLNPSTSRQMDARLDVRARGFWERGQSAFFDVRVFHPNAPSYRCSPLPTIYHRHENAKKQEYADRV